MVWDENNNKEWKSRMDRDSNREYIIIFLWRIYMVHTHTLCRTICTIYAYIALWYKSTHVFYYIIFERYAGIHLPKIVQRNINGKNGDVNSGNDVNVVVDDDDGAKAMPEQHQRIQSQKKKKLRKSLRFSFVETKRQPNKQSKLKTTGQHKNQPAKRHHNTRSRTFYTRTTETSERERNERYEESEQ